MFIYSFVGNVCLKVIAAIFLSVIIRILVNQLSDYSDLIPAVIVAIMTVFTLFVRTQVKDFGHRILQENTGNHWNIEAV
jgi:predicted PurR-regulated permease PerM